MDGDMDFFKAITPRVGAEGRLQLPSGCRKRMEALSNTITLRDRYKNLWQVEIAKHGGDWYFTKGWMIFCHENFLEVGDVLLFEYKGNDVFDFRIIGSTACDKEGAKGPLFIVKDEELELDNEEEGEENSDDLEQEVEEEEEDTETDDTYEFSNSSDDDYVEEESDDSTEDFVQVKEEIEEEEQVHVTKKVSKSKSKAHGKPGSSSSRVTQFGVGTTPRRRKYRKKNGEDCYGSDIFKSGLIRRPKNPYFVSRSRPASRANELYIPNEVINDFKLSIPEKFHLVDEEGRKWGAKVRQWGDGRLWCIRGWDTLCKANGIERDEACLCEFVQGEDEKDFCMKVRLVRN